MIQDQSTLLTKLRSVELWGVVVFVIAAILRLLMLMFYQPVSYSDTSSYWRLAGAVLGGFAKYDGTRTPGYPVFMALGGSEQGVWYLQVLLGLATTMLLYYLGWRLTHHTWFGALIGLAHTLNLGQLFFESNLLTESLTTSLLVITCVLVLLWLFDGRKRSPWLAFFIGLVSTLTLLVRPLFIYLPFFVLLFLWLVQRPISYPAQASKNDSIEADQPPPQAKRLSLVEFITFLLPVTLLLGGWIGFIHTKYGDWGLTTMTGYHLIQHTGGYFEYVPDEYASLRDTYIKYRDAQVALTGTQTNAIWEAIPEMSRVSGYNFYDLSRLLAKISVQLILHHPFLFIKNAIQGWWMFWRTSFYWSADALSLPQLAEGLSALIQVQRATLFFVNMVFIFASIYVTILKLLYFLHHRATHSPIQFNSLSQEAYFYFLGGIIWIASVLQTLLDHGDNPRFLVPLQSLVVLWVALFFILMARNMQSKERTPSHSS